MTYEQAAKRIYMKAFPDAAAEELDVSIILMIIEALQALVPILQEYCKDGLIGAIRSSRGDLAANRRGRAMVTRKYRRTLPFSDWRQFGGRFVDATIDVAHEATETELESLGKSPFGLFQMY